MCSQMPLRNVFDEKSKICEDNETLLLQKLWATAVKIEFAK